MGASELRAVFGGATFAADSVGVEGDLLTEWVQTDLFAEVDGEKVW